MLSIFKRFSLKGNKRKRPLPLIPKAGLTRSGRRTVKLGGKLDNYYEHQILYNFD